MTYADVTNERAGEPQAGALSGLELLHDVYLVLPNLASWGAVSDALHAVGAELQSLQLLRKGDECSGRCRLRGMSAEEARRSSGVLIETGLARQASGTPRSGWR